MLHQRASTLTHLDRYTKVALTVIAVLLGVLAIGFLVKPATVQAQTDAASLYIEPGVVPIRNPATGGQSGGRMVVNLINGEVWGFPTLQAGAPYPVDALNNKAPTSTPIYLGRFDFAAMRPPR